jgi:hypothetical protein
MEDECRIGQESWGGSGKRIEARSQNSECQASIPGICKALWVGDLDNRFPWKANLEEGGGY